MREEVLQPKFVRRRAGGVATKFLPEAGLDIATNTVAKVKSAKPEGSSVPALISGFWMGY